MIIFLYKYMCLGFLLNQFSTGLFVSYSVKEKPNCTKTSCLINQKCRMHFESFYFTQCYNAFLHNWAKRRWVVPPNNKYLIILNFKHTYFFKLWNYKDSKSVLILFSSISGCWAIDIFAILCWIKVAEHILWPVL